MGRSHRIDTEHGWHHVMNRGTRRWNLFLDDVDRRRFLDHLATAAEKEGVSVVCYALMGNHFHLVLYCPNGGLSNMMRDLQSSYARSFNARHGFDGPLFRSRFKSVPITDDTQLATAVRYVHRNPYELLGSDADLAAYTWSSHGQLCGVRPVEPWLDTDLLKQLLPPSLAEFREFVESPVPTDKIQNTYPPPTKHACVMVPGTVTQERSLSELRRTVAAVAGVDVVDVRPGSRNGLIGIAAIVATENLAFSAAEIADAFGFRSPGAVRSCASRARQRLETSQSDAVAYQAVLNNYKAHTSVA